MGTTESLIGYMCTASTHTQKNAAQVDHLTIVERRWAYCPGNARAQGHEWKPTGGIALVEVESGLHRVRERNRELTT